MKNYRMNMNRLLQAVFVLLSLTLISPCVFAEHPTDKHHKTSTAKKSATKSSSKKSAPSKSSKKTSVKKESVSSKKKSAPVVKKIVHPVIHHKKPKGRSINFAKSESPDEVEVENPQETPAEQPLTDSTEATTTVVDPAKSSENGETTPQKTEPVIEQAMLPKPEMFIKRAERIQPANKDIANQVLSTVAADWNNDKIVDSAVLLKSGDQIDLYFYFANAKSELELKLYKKNAVWTGNVTGTLPFLSAKPSDKNTLLLINSENNVKGTRHWDQHLTVDYRDNEFIVTAYTYNTQDVANPEGNLSCDVNLITGEGVVNKTPFKIEAQTFKLSSWSDDNIPKQCRN